jgi:N-acetyl sugar amidotransferase
MSDRTSFGAEPLEAKYGLPSEVKFCRRCVLSNQRPSSYPEFRHGRERKTPTLRIDEGGVCDACRYAETKESIDWKSREDELLKLLERYRRSDGHYDCIVPGSGGKDSVYASHVLKYKYGMHPLTVTWPPLLYTDIGLKNFRAWIENGGFDNVTFKPNGRLHRLLTRLSMENLLHPFQTFILGQKNLAPKLAIQSKVPLIFYGESEAEYGNPIAETETSLRDQSYYAMQNLSEIRLGGVPIQELIDKHSVSQADLMAYLPADYRDLQAAKIEVHYLGYYLKWTPQESYYYAVENVGFEANPVRTEGTYSKYNSLDDKIDGLHYYTTYIKFGLGRASYDASQEIRNKHLTREEGVALVHKFDGELPERYLKEVMEFIGLKPECFLELCDEFRSPHLWEKENGGWRLRHVVS